MVDEFNGAQAQQGANSRETMLPSSPEMMDSSTDNQAPAVHTPLHQPWRGVTDAQIRKRKAEESSTRQNKKAKIFSSQDCMLSDSDCEVEMEYV